MKEVRCRFSERASIIDGALTENCWQNADEVGFLEQMSGEVVTHPSRAKFCWDKEHLYICVINTEPEIDLLKAGKDDTVSIFEEDSVEVFIDVRGDARSYVQIVVNAVGRIVAFGEGRKESWKSGVKVALRHETDAWNVEMAIPFQNLGVKAVNPGDLWRVNVLRNRPGRREGEMFITSAWSPSLAITQHKPKRFGSLIFADAAGRAPEPVRPRPSVTIGFRGLAPACPMPNLTSKSDEMERIIIDHFFEDPPGWVVGFLGPGYRKLKPDDFDPEINPGKGGRGWSIWTSKKWIDACGVSTADEWVSYEQTMMATGYFLAGLARKLSLREDAKTRKIANRCVRGCYRVYELGQEIEKGFTPKPYGGKCSKQWSGDNFGDYYLGLGYYHPLAKDPERQLIEEIICESSSYWIRHRHFCPFPYFINPLHDPEKEDKNGQWPLQWLPLYRLAYEYSGKNEYRQAYDKIILDPKAEYKLEFWYKTSKDIKLQQDYQPAWVLVTGGEVDWGKWSDKRLDGTGGNWVRAELKIHHIADKPEETSIQFRNTGDGDVWFDEIMLIKMGEADRPECERKQLAAYCLLSCG